MRIVPLKGKILGLIIDENYTTQGGILIINNIKKKKPQKVRVIAVGRPMPDSNYRASVGDVAYFKKAEGIKLTIDRKPYLILENEDIIAVETSKK